jgi:hypothetical protein
MRFTNEENSLDSGDWEMVEMFSQMNKQARCLRVGAPIGPI